MTIETNRSTPIAFVTGLVVVAFCAGLALAMSGAHGQILPRAVGTVGIVAGLFLLMSRNVFKREAGASVERQVPAEYMARMRMRIAGACGILLGAAQFIPDMRLRTAVMLCAAAVSIAGVFGVPRRLFVVKESAE